MIIGKSYHIVKKIFFHNHKCHPEDALKIDAEVITENFLVCEVCLCGRSGGESRNGRKSNGAQLSATAASGVRTDDASDGDRKCRKKLLVIGTMHRKRRRLLFPPRERERERGRRKRSVLPIRSILTYCPELAFQRGDHHSSLRACRHRITLEQTHVSPGIQSKLRGKLYSKG